MIYRADFDDLDQSVTNNDEFNWLSKYNFYGYLFRHSFVLKFLRITHSDLDCNIWIYVFHAHGDQVNQTCNSDLGNYSFILHLKWDTKI